MFGNRKDVRGVEAACLFRPRARGPAHLPGDWGDLMEEMRLEHPDTGVASGHTLLHPGDPPAEV